MVEGTEAMSALVETRMAPLDCLFDHGAPDGLVLATLLSDRFQSLDQYVECLLQRWSLVLAFRRLGDGNGGRAASARFRGRRAHQIVVIKEFVAVVNEQVGRGILDAHTDNGLGVLPQLADQRREVGVAADDDEGVHMTLGVTEVERIHDHADVRGVFTRLPDVGYLDKFEGGFVQVAFEILVAIKVTVGLLDDNVSLEQEAFEHLLNVETRVVSIARSEGNVLQIEEHG